MFRCHTGWLVVLLALPAAVRANMGPPWSGGRAAGEPVGIENVSIERETLTIDLRPLASQERPRVEAVYHLNNRGPEKTLELLFASGTGWGEFQVTLDGQPLKARPDPNRKMPESWQKPETTPRPGGGRDLPYAPRNVMPVGFTATIPPGPHELAVRYAADPTTYHGDGPTIYHQLAYVLAPARSWAGFGGLDLTIHLPPGWAVACQPDLTRDGDDLTGHFSEVPADSIALTLQAPAGSLYQPLRYSLGALLILVGVGGAVACAWVGRRAARRGRRPWPRAIATGVLWGGAVFGSGLLAIFGPGWTLPAGQESVYGYGQAFAVMGVVLLGVLAVPVGVAIGLVAGSEKRGAVRHHECATAPPVVPDAGPVG